METLQCIVADYTTVDAMSTKVWMRWQSGRAASEWFNWDGAGVVRLILLNQNSLHEMRGYHMHWAALILQDAWQKFPRTVPLQQQVFAALQ